MSGGKAIGLQGGDAAIRVAMPVCVALAVYALLLLLGNRLLNDPDTYWHLTVGNWIAEHRMVPTADPFSFTKPGERWISFEWLSQLAYAGAYKLAGWTGIVVLAALAISAAFGALAFFLLRTLRPYPTLILLLAALALGAPHFLARPHVFALPVMVIWVGVLIARLDRDRPPPFWLLPVMTLWANLHPSFTLGIALIGPVALEALVRAKHSQRKAVALRWILFGLLALAAACITPYGPGMFLATYRTVALGGALSFITEWQPQNFSRIGSFEVILLLSVGYGLFTGMKLPPIRILVLLGLLHLALSQTRHVGVFAMLGPLFIAAPLSLHLYSKARSEPFRISWPGIAISVAFAAVLTLALTFHRNFAPDPKNAPAAAIAQVNIARAGPVLNDYDFGGYLIYSGIAPFIDGRAEVYGKDFIVRYNRALALQDVPDFLRLLDEYRIAATLLSPVTPAVALLDRLPGWQRVYADGVAVVHRRQNGAKPAR